MDGRRHPLWLLKLKKKKKNKKEEDEKKKILDTNPGVPLFFLLNELFNTDRQITTAGSVQIQHFMKLHNLPNF